MSISPASVRRREDLAKSFITYFHCGRSNLSTKQYNPCNQKGKNKKVKGTKQIEKDFYFRLKIIIIDRLLTDRVSVFLAGIVFVLLILRIDIADFALSTTHPALLLPAITLQLHFSLTLNTFLF